MNPGPVTRRQTLAGAAATGALPLAGVATQGQAASDDCVLAALVERIVVEAGEATGQPGAAVAVVRSGRIVTARGYGVCRLGEPAAVAPSTLFGVASVSKAFTAASLALLVDEGRLRWDDPVRLHLPDFTLSDPEVSDAITVRDLLLHNSGLALGAGDLMVWPYTLHSRSEILAGLRHLPLTRPFRSGYAYDNVLYTAAGEVVARLRSLPLEQAIEAFLLRPAGLTDAVALPSLASMRGDFAWPHARLSQGRRGEGAITPLARGAQVGDNDVAAGGLCLSARDAARWLQILLARGALPEGGRVWSEARAAEMWEPGVVIRAQDGPRPGRPDRANFDTYALGWQVSDYRGRRMVWHGGYSPGGVSTLCLLPGLDAGVAVFSNAEEHGFGRAVSNTVLDALIGVSDVDWVETFARQPPRSPPSNLPVLARTKAPPSRPLAAYAGTWTDSWYGDIRVSADGEGLRLDFLKTPGMAGPLLPWAGDTFRADFEDRNIEPAFITFDLSFRPATARMRAVSPGADFSYDYHDLRLTRP